MNTPVNKLFPLEKYPEIIIGIVSPVGTETQLLIQAFQESFKKFDYEFFHIKLSKHFPDIEKKIKSDKLDKVSEEDRIEKYIEFGNFLREKFGNDFLAKIAVNEIIKSRAKDKKDEDEVNFKKRLYIIDQLKTKEEIDLLRLVYGGAFFQVSVYSARDRRVDYLAKKKARANNKRDGSLFRDKAEALVNRDYDENSAHGQKVGKIFQLADVIINTDKQEEHPVSEQVKRFVKLLFGSNEFSPNKMEYGMYLAHSAALRSLDLSRQVGAAIFRCTGEIATLGANEVPKAGGGTYWTDEKYDAREFKKQIDSNDERKQELLREILDILGKTSLPDEERKRLDDSQFMDALEYGRIIHAEMSAITDAARLGISLKDTILYCTTFPCHMCSKHIVASGIREVVFLEPYPKSLTSDIHADSVKIEGTSRHRYASFPTPVNFIPFHGITPVRYRELFHRTKRKNKNRGFISYKDEPPSPIFAPLQPSYSDSENIIGQDIKEKYKPYLNQGTKK